MRTRNDKSFLSSNYLGFLKLKTDYLGVKTFKP